MRLIRSLLALMLAFGLLTPAHAGQNRSPMFPPDMTYPGGFLERHEEPALWSNPDAGKYAQRLRISITGINRLAIIIRIDVLRNGRGLGTVITSRHNINGSRNVERGVFVVPASGVRALQEKIAEAKLWERPRQGWGMADDNDICIDGEELLLERMDASGYSAAAANAQCTAPGAVLAVAQKMIDLSGASRASGLLY